MGVRFQCPNGHKLHVKAELAGKRGICPDCGVKFIVPSFSGGRVAEDTGNPPPLKVEEGPRRRGARGGTATTAAREPAIGVKTAIPSSPDDSVVIPNETPRPQPAAPPNSHPEPAAWYVRPPTGGQFGPASTEVFQQWIDEGRVAPDCWVWRTGWPDWKAGSEALALVADRPPLEPVLAMAAAEGAILPTPESIAAKAHIEPGSAEARRAEIKRRKQQVRKLSAVLSLVALAMLVVLVVVLAS
jgi:hypothetical protein